MNEDVEMKDETHNQPTTKTTSTAAAGAALPLIEKYRPTSLNEIVSHEDILSTINLFVERKTIPHFLFHGPPGTGKTSCILALAHQLYGDTYKSMTLELNASDDRGINIVREKIKDFCGALSSFNTMMALHNINNTTNTNTKTFKLVILDEADMMTSAAQFALRRVIEKYTKNVRFCLICNQVNKIIPAIQSRCMRFRFGPLNREQCLLRLKDICNRENIPFTSDDALRKVINIGKGDMRKILNILESTFMSFDTITEDNVYSSAGLPTATQVQQMINQMMDKNKKFGDVYDNLNSFRIENGFAMGDLIWEITKLIRYNKEISVDVKNKCFKTLKEMDYLDNIGGNEKIILSNLISLIRNI